MLGDQVVPYTLVAERMKESAKRGFGERKDRTVEQCSEIIGAESIEKVAPQFFHRVLLRLWLMKANGKEDGNRNDSQINRHNNRVGGSCFSDKREDFSGLIPKWRSASFSVDMERSTLQQFCEKIQFGS